MGGLADNLERWEDISESPKKQIACSERWKEVAALIGCTLHGFNDGSYASFWTPDGTCIEVGPKFRAAICALPLKHEGKAT